MGRVGTGARYTLPEFTGRRHGPCQFGHPWTRVTARWPGCAPSLTPTAIFIRLPAQFCARIV